MPQYEVNSPDGKTYTVNAPDGATEQDAISYVQRQFYKEPAGDKKPAMERVAQGLRDPIDGGAQLLTKILPDSVVNAGNSLNNWLADKTGLVGKLPEGGVDQQVREREKAYQAERGQGAGFDGMRLLGNMLSPANLAIGVGLGGGATLPMRMASGAAVGAAGNALTPVTNEGNFTDQKAAQIAEGALFGGLTPAAVSAVSRVVSPKASVNPQVQLLKDEGVTPTLGQALGGRWNAAEEKLMSAPLLGDAISGARGRANEQFNNAAINRALKPIGENIDGSGQDAVKKAGDLISAAYENGKTALGGFRIDNQASAELSSLRQMAATGLEGRERKAFESYFKNYLTKPALTAQSFKELDSKLGADIGKFSSSNDAYQQKLGDALKEVQSIITDNAKRANPQAAEMLKNADAAWANLVRVEGASKAAMNNGGVFSPAQLNSAVRGADRSVRDRATARGTALMQDLGNAGQQVLGNNVPNSGTTDRALLNLLVSGGGAMVHPGIPLGLLGGASLYTSPAQALLSGAVTARPQSAEAMAEALRQASPGLGLLGGQVGTQLLGY